MGVIVRLSASLASFADGRREIPVVGPTVGDAIGDFSSRYEELAERLFFEDGALRNFINLYVNEMDIRDLDGLATAVVDGDVIAVIPAVAGGAPMYVNTSDDANESHRVSNPGEDD